MISMWEAILLTNQIIIFATLGWFAWQYIRLKRRVRTALRKMDCDELLDQLMDVGTTDAGTTPTSLPPGDQRASGPRGDDKRQRLAALAAGGQTKQYIGRQLTADEVDNMVDNDVERLYARYEAKLGAAMTKTLGTAALQFYAAAASMFYPYNQKIDRDWLPTSKLTRLSRTRLAQPRVCYITGMASTLHRSPRR